MSIHVSDELRQWPSNKNLQGFIKVAEAEPHPNADTLIQQIHVTSITTKKVRTALQLRRGGFDVVQKVSDDNLRSYFGAYSPSAKAYQTYGGRNLFCHEVARFLLEIAFVSPRFYCMPKKRASFIIAAFEGEEFDWALLSAEALREQLHGVQNGKPMKAIFAHWLWVLFLAQESENQSEVRRSVPVQPPRRSRQVPREEWREEESAQANINRTEFEQSEPIQQQESEQPFTPQPEPEQQPTTTQSEDEPPLTQQQQSKPVEQQEQEAPQVDTHQQSPIRGRVKQRAQRYSRPEEDEPAPRNRKPTSKSLRLHTYLVSIPTTRHESRKASFNDNNARSTWFFGYSGSNT